MARGSPNESQRTCFRSTAPWTAAAGVLAAVLLVTSAAGQAAAAALAICESLAGAKISDTMITTAQLVPTGSFTPPGTTTPIPNLPAFCRVVGSVSTQPGEDVGIEVWLPLSTWNGRFEGTGNGGFGGAIIYSALAAGIERGFATANTDTGHTGGVSGQIGQPLPWAQNKIELSDWGHTSIHLMTVAAKRIVRALYGREASFSYFDGCSTGGAEGMEEAQFYPTDYDGIHADSPGQDYSHLMMSFLWGGLLPAKNASAKLSQVALNLLNNAVPAGVWRSTGCFAGISPRSPELPLRPDEASVPKWAKPSSLPDRTASRRGRNALLASDRSGDRPQSLSRVCPWRRGDIVAHSRSVGECLCTAAPRQCSVRQPELGLDELQFW